MTMSSLCTFLHSPVNVFFWVEILSSRPCSHAPSICFRVKSHVARPRNTTNKTIIVLFLYFSNSRLFNYTVNSSNYIEHKCGSIMNWKGFEKKWLWPNIRHYPEIFLNLLKKGHKSLVCRQRLELIRSGIRQQLWALDRLTHTLLYF
jgi:hypothetical protein